MPIGTDSDDLKVLRSMYQAAPIAIATVSDDGRFLDANPAFESYLGYTEAELATKRFSDVTFPEDLGVGQDLWRDVVAGRRDRMSIEKRYVRKNGEVLWGRLHCSAVRNASGTFLRAISQITDISHEKRVLESQSTLLSLLEATLDATNEGLLVVDLAGKIVTSNRRFADLWRIPPDLLARRNDAELLEFAQNQLVYPELFIRRVQRVYANRDEESSDILEFKDGQILARTSRAQLVDGATTGTVWSFRDVTTEMRAEAAQKEAFEKEQTARGEAETERVRAEILSETSRILASSLDYDTTIGAILGCIVPRVGDWSGVAVVENENMRLVGFRSDPPRPDIAARIGSLTILDMDSPKGIPKVIRTGTSALYPVVTEADLSTEDGNWPVVGTRDPQVLAVLRTIGLRSFMIVPLVVRGKVIGAVSVARANRADSFGPDDLRFAEEIGRRCAIALDSATLYRDALRTIRVREDFLSVASHELRTPLSPLRMQFEMAELFAKEVPKSFAKRAELLDVMAGAGRQMDRLLRLVDNLLDVSRITAGTLKLHPTWFDLVALVREIAARFAPAFAKARCEASFRFPDRLEGFWDATRIEQVVVNLFSNAIKFGVGAPIVVSIAARNGEAHLAIADGGIGVSAEDQLKIFERFDRGSSPPGTHGFGLGLYICREIVSAHSGKISVESELGRGAKFVVRLPMRTRGETARD